MLAEGGKQRRETDWIGILLLLPYLLLTLVPYLKLRIRFSMALPFAAFWMWWNIARNRRCFKSKNFLAFSVTFAVFLALRLAMYSLVDGQVAFYPLFVTNCISIFPIFILYFLYRDNCITEIKILAVAVLLCMASGAISSATLETGEARALASVARNYDMEINRLELMNQSAATYGSVYGMGLIVVAIIYGWMKFPPKVRVFMTVVLVVFVAGIVKAAYSIAIIMTLAGLAFAAMALRTHGKARTFRRICFSSCLALVLVMAFPRVLGPLAKPLYGLSMQMDAYEYSMRLESIADAVSGFEDTYSVGRASLYWLSLGTFLRNPLIGKFSHQFLFGGGEPFVATDYIGGHSFFFDTLGQLGLLGFYLLALSIRGYRRFLHDYFAHSSNPSGEISCDCAYYALLLASCLNPVLSPEIILAFVFVVPALPLFYRRQL